MIVAVVTGSRNAPHLETWQAFRRVFESLRPVIVIDGGCRGADESASDAARLMRIPTMRVPALWEEQGRKAGPMRNRRMIRFAEDIAGEIGAEVVLVAAPGGRGTADYIRAAESRLLRIVQTTEEKSVGQGEGER